MNDIDRACLLASNTKQSGAWLHALPISLLGLQLDNNSLTIAVSVHLGTPLCGPHQCSHCWEEMDVMSRHEFSFQLREGRHHRHAAINDIIHCALTSAGVPARLEPPGLLHSDDKRSNSVLMVPWRSGMIVLDMLTVRILIFIPGFAFPIYFCSALKCYFGIVKGPNIL